MDSIVLALNSDRIDQVNDLKYLVQRINNILLSAYTIAGYNPPNDKDLAGLSAKLLSELRTSFAGLRVDELAICVENGAKEMYGEFHGISLRTILRWIRQYKTSDARCKAILQLEKEKGKSALPPPGPEYGEQKMEELALRYFEDHKNGGSFWAVPERVYQYLQGRGIIQHTPEFKWGVLNKIKELHAPRLNNLIFPKELDQHKILNEAQEICLKSFFDELIGMGMELKDLLKTK